MTFLHVLAVKNLSCYCPIPIWGSIVFTKRLQSKLSLLEFKSLEGESFSITVSIGISQFESKLDMDAWLNQADEAMYKAKESGRDQFKCYGFLE